MILLSSGWFSEKDTEIFFLSFFLFLPLAKNSGSGDPSFLEQKNPISGLSSQRCVLIVIGAMGYWLQTQSSHGRPVQEGDTG